MAFIFSQKNAWQMVAQLFLPFSLIAPHPGCSWKQCSSLFWVRPCVACTTLLEITCSCTDLSKGAASPTTPLFIMGALTCGSWVGFHPGLLLCHLLFPISLWTGATGLLLVCIILSRLSLQETQLRKLLHSPWESSADCLAEISVPEAREVQFRVTARSLMSPPTNLNTYAWGPESCPGPRDGSWGRPSSREPRKQA